ncbi:unnamed protein product [marine sediment metagenome]|uniref:Uncharacterized protein n=1 Tax=marine sediment metagenome TaxID=412755 RepID=X1P3X1_9ZZZZ
MLTLTFRGLFNAERKEVTHEKESKGPTRPCYCGSYDSGHDTTRDSWA